MPKGGGDGNTMKKDPIKIDFLNDQYILCQTNFIFFIIAYYNRTLKLITNETP